MSEAVARDGSDRAPTRRLSSDQRRKSMIEVARTVFLQRGYEGARTKDIAQAAGVSEAIIYRHFASKEDIFEAAVLEPLKEHLDEFSRLTADFAQLRGRERLERSAQIHASALIRMQEIVPLLGVALFADGKNGRIFYKRHVAPILDRGSSLVASALTGWEHAPTDPDFLFRSIFGTYFMLALDSTMRNRKLDTVSAGQMLTDLINLALTPQRGTARARKAKPAVG